MKEVRENPEVILYLKKTNEYLSTIGYTEHGLRHADITSRRAKEILDKLGFPKRTTELASIAGYLHDIGNIAGRDHHGAWGALMAKDVLDKMDMHPEEIFKIMAAIGNHEEDYGDPVIPEAASLIIADKSDVHRTRVTNPSMPAFDIHDRVNYSATRSRLVVDKENKVISLQLKIDTKISRVMEYFEIFLSRMVISRRAAQYLKTKFELVINNSKLL